MGEEGGGGLARECSGVSWMFTPHTKNYVATEAGSGSGCGPVMMCSQSPQCPDGPEHTLSQPHTLFALRRPTSCRSSALWSRSSPRGPPLTSSPLSEEKTTTAMAHSVCRLVLLVLVGLLVAFVHAGKRCCFCALQPRCSDTAEALVCLLSALKVLRRFLILLKRELRC